MKITRIETIPVRVPIQPRRAIRSSLGRHTESPFLLLRVHTDEGLTGLGEVSCTPRWSGEDNVIAAHVIREYLEPLWVGEDPSQIELLRRKLRQGVFGHTFTKSGLEMALWDLAGKAAGQPVYKLLGGKVRDFVPTKFSISGLEPSQAAEIAAWAKEQGFRTMKVKVGIQPAEDIARVRAVRTAIGDEVRLGVDANGGWSKREAIQTLRALEGCQLHFAEQPVPALDVQWMADVRRAVTMPVLADESCTGPEDAMALVRAEAADVLSAYVGKGGIGPARQVAAIAAGAGIVCTVGSNLELGVAASAMIHLALATPSIAAEDFPCDILTPFYYEDDVVTEAPLISGGMAQARDLPGLGVELDDDKIARYRMDQ